MERHPILKVELLQANDVSLKLGDYEKVRAEFS